MNRARQERAIRSTSPSLRPFLVSLSRLAQRSPRRTDVRRGRGVDGRGGNSRIEAAAAERCAGRKRKDGRKEGGKVYTLAAGCVLCVSRRQSGDARGIQSAAKESALGEGVLSYLCVYLDSVQCQILNHSKMVKLTEEMIVARTRVSDMANVKKLNCW